jgi:hypothetical protein
VLRPLAFRYLAPLFRVSAIGSSNQLKQMAVRVVKIDAATAIQVVDFATSCAVKVRVEFNSSALNAGENSVELRFRHEECAVLMADVRVVSVVDCDPVSCADRDEMRPLRSCLQSQDARQMPTCPWSR